MLTVSTHRDRFRSWGGSAAWTLTWRWFARRVLRHMGGPQPRSDWPPAASTVAARSRR